MNRKILVIDIDDTLAQTTKAVMELMHQSFGNEYTASIVDLLKNHRHPEDVTFWQTTEARSFITQLLESKDFLTNIDPVNDAVQVVTTLAATNTIVYMTSRLDIHYDVTNTWLSTHEFPIGRLICRTETEIRQNWKIHTLAGDKDFNQENTVFIDDTIEAFVDVPTEYKGSCILLTHWFMQTQTHDIHTCHSWPEVFMYLNEH